MRHVRTWVGLALSMCLSVGAGCRHHDSHASGEAKSAPGKKADSGMASSSSASNSSSSAARSASATGSPSGSGTAGAAGVASEKSLYERLGGKEAITAVVDDFVNRGAADPKVNFTRQNVPGVTAWQATPENVAKVKQRIAEFVVMAAGGPKTYEGETMKVSHSGMKITDAEFDALAADLRASLEKFKVPKKEADELMAVVGTTRKDIVEKRAGGQ